MAGKRELRRNGADVRDDLVRERERREAAGRVARVDAALLDMLQHGSHVALVSVAEGIDIELDGILEEGVEIDRVVRRDLRCLAHVRLEVVVVVDDCHAAAAQDIARTDQERVADVLGDSTGLVQGLGDG